MDINVLNTFYLYKPMPIKYKTPHSSCQGRDVEIYITQPLAETYSDGQHTRQVGLTTCE
jgi:hypothetical protein